MENKDEVKIFHPTIPIHIPKEKIWNDCWWDEQRGIFCILNKGILKIAPDYQEREEYKRHFSTVGIDCFYKDAKEVKFYHTLPYIEDTTKTIMVILPTLKDKQITKDMIALRKSGKMYYNTEEKRLVPHRVLPIQIPMTEEEYRLDCQTTGIEYIIPEKRIAMWRFIKEKENWTNKEFEDKEYEKMIYRLGKYHKEIPTLEIKKYGEIILEMAKTIDMESWRVGEGYKKQNQYSDRRIETKSVDGKLIVFGFEIYKGAVMYDSIKDMVSKITTLRMVKDALANNEEEFTSDINEKIIKCYDNIINLNLKEAIKNREILNETGCINNNYNLRSMIPLEIDMAIEYLTKYPQSELVITKNNS